MERTGPFARLAHAIPQGRGLPAEVFRSRHRAILWILTGHVVGIAIFAVALGYSLLHSLFEASIVGVLALMASYPRFGRKLQGAIAAAGLVSASAILVHLSRGSIEMHFHFFVVLGLMTLYQDWAPYGMAFIYVALHHGIMGAVDPTSVYNHEAAQRGPWVWASIHAAFIAAAGAVQLFSWSMNEKEHARVEHFRLKIHEADLRRKQALEINDSVLQGLIVAQLADTVGHRDEAKAALDGAINDARGIVSSLLDESANDEGRIEPGTLIRDRAAVSPGAGA